MADSGDKPEGAAAAETGGGAGEGFVAKVIELEPYRCPPYKLPASAQLQLQQQQQLQRQQSLLAELESVNQAGEADSVSSLSEASEGLMTAVQDDPDLYDSYVSGRIDFDQLADTVRRRYVSVGPEAADEANDDDDEDDDGEDLVRELLSADSPPPPPTQKQRPASVRPRQRRRTTSPDKSETLPSKRQRRAAAPASGASASAAAAAESAPSETGAGGGGGGGGVFVSFLDESLRGLVGQASLQLAKGDSAGAIRICEEVMKIQPRSHEVYETMHEAYEKLGQAEKSAQFLLLAAHLHRSDPSKWCRLAELSRSVGKFKEAAQYLTSAIRIGGPDTDMLRVERAELYKLAGDTSAYLRAYLDVLRRIEMEAEQALQLARELADGFYKQDDCDRAAACYEVAFQRFPALRTDAETNIAIDLLFKSASADRFARALHLLVTHYGVALALSPQPAPKSSTSTVSSQHQAQPRRLSSGATIAELDSALKSAIADGLAVDVEVPDSLLPDLLAKLAVSLAGLGCPAAAHPAVSDPLLALPPLENSDLLMDVAEALSGAGMHAQACRVLERLLQPGACEDKAAVWLSYAQCLKELGRLTDCVAAYERTIQLAPDYHQARLALSDVQVSLGQSAEALETLRLPASSTGDSAVDATAESAQLALNRCLMLMHRDPAAFELEAWRLVFGRLEPLFASLSCASLPAMQALFTRGRRADSLVDRANKAFGRAVANLSADDLWDVYRRLVQWLFDSRQWDRLDLATTWALYHPAFSSNRRRCEQINLLALTSSFYTGSLASVLQIAKDFCCRYQDRSPGPNTLALVASLTQCNERVPMRMAARLPRLRYPLLLMTAQGFLLTGKYRRALLTLTHLRRLRQDDPLVPLLAASAFASLACQRQLANRHFFVANACAMLTCYAQLRAPSGCQEVAYNTARILHRLGLFRHAVAAYERALSAQPEGDTLEQRRRNDLRLPAAHNLLVLYKAVGNEAMVSRLLHEHLVID